MKKQQQRNSQKRHIRGLLTDANFIPFLAKTSE